MSSTSQNPGVFVLLLPAPLPDAMISALLPAPLKAPCHFKPMSQLAARIQEATLAGLRFNPATGKSRLGPGLTAQHVKKDNSLYLEGRSPRMVQAFVDAVQAQVHALVAVRTPLGDIVPMTPREETSSTMVSFQAIVVHWVKACFGAEIAANISERRDRFTEEALELVQASGGTREDVLKLVDYVFGRSVGEVNSEVGGTLTTLAALCSAQGIDMGHAAHSELAKNFARIPEIRAKRALKPANSPLP